MYNDNSFISNNGLGNENNINNNKKNNKKNIIIYAILLMIIAGLVLYICYDKGYFNKSVENEKKETAEKVKKEKKVEKPEDTELSEAEKKEISTKANEILTFGINTSSDDVTSSIISWSGIDDTKTYVENVESQKLFTVLNIYGRADNGGFRELNSTEKASVPEKLKRFLPYELSIIDASTITNKYKEIFGEEPNHKEAGRCIKYEYNPNQAVYYKYEYCGGTGNPTMLIYKDGYKKQNGEVEVDVSIATASNVDNRPLTKEVYKGIVANISDNAYGKENLLYTKDFEDDYTEEIKANHDKYAKYKIVFVKDNSGNYTYKSLKKI